MYLKHESDLVKFSREFPHLSETRKRKKKVERELICVKSRLKKLFPMKSNLKEGCRNEEFESIVLYGWKRKRKRKKAIQD